MAFKCDICSTQFTFKTNLRRHMRKHLEPTEIDIFSCPECKKTFNRKDAFQCHLQIHSKHGQFNDEMDGFPKTHNDYGHTSNDILSPNQDIQMSTDISDVEEIGQLQPKIKTLKTKKPAPACNQEQEEWSKSPIAESFTCTKCDKVFTFRTNLYRHMKTHSQGSVVCKDCGAVVSRKDKLLHHKRFVCPATRIKIASVPFVHNPTTHSSTEEPMDQDVEQPSKTKNYDNLSTGKPLDQDVEQPSKTGKNVYLSTEEQMDLQIDQPTRIGNDTNSFAATEKAFQSRLVTYELKRKFSKKFTIALFLTFVFDHVTSLLQKVQETYNCVKINIFLECEFINTHGETCLKNFKTNNTPLFKTTDIESLCSELFHKLVKEKEECDFKGSGWSFVKVKKFEIRVNKYNPLKGASYIPSPRKYAGIINVYNLDDFCFKYSILAKFVQGDARYPANYTPELQTKYNWESIDFPVKLNDIPKFERDNNISINVFGLDKESKMYPLKVCNKELPDHRDLLLLTNENSGTHYVYIRDFNKAIKSQLVKTNNPISICKRCFAYFENRPNKLGLSGEERLIEHQRYCASKTPLRLDLSPDPFISFKHPERSQRVRFAIYADFECSLIPNDMLDSDSITHTHEPHSYCYLIKDSLSSFDPIVRLYRGANAAKHFVESINNDVLKIGEKLYKERRMTPTLTPAEEAAHIAATQCYICGLGYTSEKDPKVRDHMHSTPYTYRGAAHSSCNIRHQEQNTINCYFHNLTYDSHFIIKELGYDDKEISVIANSEEKYISFTKYIPYKKANRGVLKLRFVDTLRFLPSSLSKLADNLPNECFIETKRRFPDPTQFTLLTRKGVFPYSYISSVEKLQETQLPPRQAFYNKLTLETISEQDFKHAEDVWKTFNIKDLGQYSDLYLLTDVLLLTDIFEHFRDASLKSHQLDPAYYITLPSYSWDCMLKNTNIKLETIQDHDIYLFFENGIRGGISQCMKRRSVANNKYCTGYDPSKGSKYLTYVDANNLYGWAQSQYLPTGGFRWLDKGEIDCLDIETVPDESNVGYVLEVDVEYPQSLHDRHRDLPFLCERKSTPGSKHPKLLTTLENKKNYIAHYRILKQALKHGLKVTKIHRVVRFDQSPWLKPYIDLNTNLRKAAKNDFEKDLFKLYNNSVFGKTMENVRKRLNYKLTTSEQKAEKLIAKPNFLHRTIISETMVGINLAKENIVLEKPLYVGMCILELSKELMYKFYYEVIVPHYGEDNVRLIYMDTDSFVIEVFTPDLYNSFLPIVYHLDTSSLPKNNPAYQPDNAKVLGKFKDELNGTYIQEFLGVRTKVYCVVKEDELQDPIKKCKGITKPVVSKILRAEDYRRCIMENEDWYTMNTTFRSYRHDVKTKWENKLTLSGYDFKRHLCADGVNTLPYGHCDIC